MKWISKFSIFVFIFSLLPLESQALVCEKIKGFDIIPEGRCKYDFNVIVYNSDRNLECSTDKIFSRMSAGYYKGGKFCLLESYNIFSIEHNNKTYLLTKCKVRK